MTVLPADTWTNPLVKERYERYMREHYRDFDMANLLETIAQWASNRTVDALVTFSDIGPQLGRLEKRLSDMRTLIESLSKAEQRHVAEQAVILAARALQRSEIQPIDGWRVAVSSKAIADLLLAVGGLDGD